jgi:hypothetical protein
VAWTGNGDVTTIGSARDHFGVRAPSPIINRSLSAELKSTHIEPADLCPDLYKDKSGLEPARRGYR